MKDKFSFHSVDNMDILSESFNSSFSFKCQKTTNLVLGSEKYIFNYNVDFVKTDKPYSHIDYIDMMTVVSFFNPSSNFIRLMNFANLLTTYWRTKPLEFFIQTFAFF